MIDFDFSSVFDKQIVSVITWLWAMTKMEPLPRTNNQPVAGAITYHDLSFSTP